jgi:hypothetical protein
MNQLYTSSINLIIGDDININYLDSSNNKLQLDSLLASYSLHSTVDFPISINGNSSTAIYNIFIDKYKYSNFTINPVAYDLSDYDAQ